MDALDEAIKIAGGVSRLATQIGQAQNTVSNWRARGRVPIAPCGQIERATGVKRWHLRPTDWHLIWPELVEAADAPPVPGISALGELDEGTNAQQVAA